MSDLTKLLADAHIEDLRRNAGRFATRRAAPAADRQSRPAHDEPITIRRATADDEPALAGLASLDSARIPAGAVLLAESRGKLTAALSLEDGAAIADPFRPTAGVVELLVTWAAQDARGRRMLLRRRRRVRTRRRALRGGRGEASPLLS
jgi:hypothetical protein